MQVFVKLTFKIPQEDACTKVSLIRELFEGPQLFFFLKTDMVMVILVVVRMNLKMAIPPVMGKI